jgi:hypothetical protein
MTAPTLSRRRLIFGAFATIGGAIAGAYHWRRLRHPSAADISTLIRQRLGHLDLDLEGVDRFARDYVERYGAFSMSVHHRDTLGGTLRLEPIRQLLPSRRQQSVLNFERRMVSYYLRSTDYFQPKRATPVRYVAFVDPYAGACTNPFAVLEL